MDKKNTKYKEGHIPWNTGKKGLCLNSGRTHFTSEKLKGNKHAAGKIPWNKGLKNPYSKETLKKISDSLKGSIPWNKGLNKNIDNRIKPPKTVFVDGKFAGENHYNWKGGITPENEKERKSKKYKAWRRTVFIRDEFTCQKCGIHHVYIVAHHIKPFSKYPLLRTNTNNGITLCKDCHKEIHLLGDVD